MTLLYMSREEGFDNVLMSLLYCVRNFDYIW